MFNGSIKLYDLQNQSRHLHAQKYRSSQANYYTEKKSLVPNSSLNQLDEEIPVIVRARGHLHLGYSFTQHDP